ncbi:hypothetical protein ACWE42_14595 [Sutcliffiella cohnii]
MSIIQDVVHGDILHRPLIKERITVKKQPEVIMKCVGERKEPSKEAVNRFIEIYIRMVKENEVKQKRLHFN